MVRGSRLFALLPVVALACGDDDPVAIVVAPDAGAEGLPTSTATVRTNAPAGAFSLPGPNNATFAMALGADGTWSPLEPRALGVYAVPVAGDRWTAAFVCADQDNSYVQIYDRAASVTELVLDLPSPCELEPALVGDLAGTFAHAPLTTSWFDFGYIAGERGSVLPLEGDSAPYEIVNVVSGTWDVVFGFRDDSAGPLTKLFLMRDEPIAPGPTKLDADLTTVGIDPGAKALTVSGLADGDIAYAPVVYALAGGPHGIDMGPQTTAGPNLTYATVPLEHQRPSDRYRVGFYVRTPDDSARRGVNAVFHDAVDVYVDLAPALPAPLVSTLGTTPYLRLSMKTVGRANAATYELFAITETTERTGRRWLYSTDRQVAEGAEVGFEMPDFSNVTGWNGAWTIQPDRSKVTATVREKSSPLSDGTSERWSAHTVDLIP